MAGTGTAVSVVIPSHNDLRTLPAAVDSVLRQSAPAAECIVISDASEDGTDEWLKGRDGVRWRAVSVRSPALARNAGIEMATSPFVAFLDADDVWHADRLALLQRQLAARPDGVIWACTWRREGRPLAPLPSAQWVSGHSRRIPYEAFLGMNQFQTSTVAARRSALEAVGAFDPSVDGAEDWDLWTRLARTGDVWLTPAPLVTYRTGSGRVSSDGGRVYRRGLDMLRRQGASERQVAWHHLRFAYAFARQGNDDLAAQADAQARAVDAPTRLALRARFGLYLSARAVRRAAEGARQRLGR